MKVDLNETDKSILHACIPDTTDLSTTNKRNPDGNRKESDTQDNAIVFPVFDLSIKRVGFGNGNAQVTTVDYKIPCHPVYTTILKSILIQASVLGHY